MLDERDLQAIAKMIGDSEARTAEKIRALEARTDEKFAALEASTAEKISESEAHMMAMMEAHFDPKFNLLADVLKLIQEDTEDRVDVLEAVVQRHSREIEALKKAQ